MGDTRGVGFSERDSEGGVWSGEHAKYRQVMGGSYGGEVVEENGKVPVAAL